MEKNFTVSEVWKAIKTEYPKVIWYRHVWFTQCIPRHAFITWVAIRERLKTRDRLARWFSIPDLSCLLCKENSESHSHLFFSCSFSKRLWERLKPMALLEDLGNKWAMERNNRRVELREKSIDILFNIIIEFVRLKLMGLTLKGTPDVIKAYKVWNLLVKSDKNGLGNGIVIGFSTLMIMELLGGVTSTISVMYCCFTLVFSMLSDLAAGTLYSSGWVSSSSFFNEANTLGLHFVCSSLVGYVIMVDDIFFSLFAFYLYGDGSGEALVFSDDSEYASSFQLASYYSYIFAVMSGKINTAGANVNTAGSKPTVNHPRSISNAYKKGYSQVTRPFNKYSEYKNSSFNKKVNTVRVKDTTVRDRAVVSENKGKRVNAIKASACWRATHSRREYKKKEFINMVAQDVDLNNLETTINVSHIPITRIDKDHPKDQITGDFNLTIQTRRMTKISDEHAMDRSNEVIFGLCIIYGVYCVPDGCKECLLICTIEEEVYVCQPPGFEDPQFPDKVYKVEKALYGLHQAPKAWYETLSTYLIENGFRRGTINKNLFIKKNKGLMHKRFQMSSIRELTFFLGLQVQQKKDGIFISQDKYVADILKKFDFATVKTASTPMEPNKALIKDEEADSVDVHLYRSMIGSLMYLTASRPDIMFAVCACARFQVTPKMSHLHAVKRIFRYLKGQPKLGLWYPRDSPFDLEAFSDSDYAGASLDRKSTTGGCQFLGKRLISWQCKKQTIVANSTTEAEYVAAANCCGQVLWIQNQMLDYGFNFMNTKIFIDNESTICIVKNPVFHSKTKHIEIRHHFIRDCYEKKLIQVIKIHTDHNVADLLTKAKPISS
ncbi:putative ribonuclease H-like domain-containing protein [Tanacetum coccineum]|uniref:Ribonuclease H-like domain-containing protein n=1 Tax=Tanacetum coccineum TaxID=301880 RepID=A0ABQ5AEB4_9ASTR